MDSKKTKLNKYSKRNSKITRKTNSKKIQKKQVLSKKKRRTKKRIQIDGENFFHTPHYFDKKIGDNVIEGRPTPLNALLLQHLFNNNKVEIKEIKEKTRFFFDDNIVLVKKKGTPKEFRNKEIEFDYITEEPIEVKTNTYIIPSKRPLNYPENLKKGKFYTKVKKSNGTPVFTYQNVEYVNNLIKQLQQPIVNNKDLNTKDFIGDLQYKGKNIFYGLKPNESIEVNGKPVIIVGYPDPKHMNPFFQYDDLLTSGNTSTFNDLIENQKQNLTALIAKLHNLFVDEDFKLINANINNEDNDLFKLLSRSGKTDLQALQQMKEQYKISDDKLNMEEIKSKYETKCKALVKNLFNRPNMRLRYIFHPFMLEKRPDGTTELLPMIYSIRELKSTHTKVLKTISNLIKTEIPGKYGLLFDGETECDSFYSYYPYGELFHIETEYIHPTMNLDTFPYAYQKRIMLEELIYLSGLVSEEDGENNGKPFWSRVKFEYPNKSFNELTNIPIISQKGGILKDLKDLQEFKFEKCNLIMCNQVFDYQVDIYFEKEKQLYFMKLKMDLNESESFKLVEQIKEDINFKLSTLKHGSYSVMDFKKLEEGDENNKKYTLFKNSYYYPILKLNQSNEKHNTDNYYPLLHYNIISNYYKIFVNKQKISFKNGKNNVIEYVDNQQSYEVNEELTQSSCYTSICNNDKLIAVMPFYRIYKGGNYLFIIFKEKKGEEFKYVMWVYKLELDENGSIKIDSNTINNVFDIEKKKKNEGLKDYLQSIMDDFLSEGKGDNFKFFVNKIIAPVVNVLHIQILKPKYYTSSLYKRTFSPSIETRLLNFNNVLNFLNIKNNYFDRLGKLNYNMVFIPPRLNLLI